MKESPNPNYDLDVRDLVGENWDKPDLSRFIDGGWLLTVNHCVSITFLPYLPTSPWPPPIPDDFDSASDRDGAMRVLLATSEIVVTPTDGPERTEDLVSHIEELQTVFWVSRERYARLDAELARLKRLPRVPAIEPRRLHALPDSELKRFLRSDLARAALADYDRKILCVRARDAPGFDLDSAIADLYAVFARYPAPTGVTRLPYAITDADEKRERVAPLRALAATSLVKYSFRDDREFRHFLPRLLELTAKEPAWTDVPSVFDKLADANWRQWPTEEQAAVDRYFSDLCRAALEGESTISSVALIQGAVAADLPVRELLVGWGWGCPFEIIAAEQLATLVQRFREPLLRTGSFGATVPAASLKDFDALVRAPVTRLRLVEAAHLEHADAKAQTIGDAVSILESLGSSRGQG